jgi:hypothetical protein
MSWLVQRIVTTPHGVYQPPPVRLEATLFALALLFVAVSFLLNRISPAYALCYLALLVVPFIFRVRGYRKFGALGQPTDAIVGSTLVFARPADSRGALNFEIAPAGAPTGSCSAMAVALKRCRCGDRVSRRAHCSGCRLHCHSASQWRSRKPCLHPSAATAPDAYPYNTEMHNLVES